MSNVTKILAVVGAKELGELCRHALGHPGLAVEVVRAERDILAALESGEFSVAVAGPGVGRRPPLVVADALRLRVPGLRVVVLVGSETDEQDLREHQGRELAGVIYLDLSGLISDHARGSRIRAAVLEAAAVAEDEVSGQSWADRWQEALQAEVEAPVEPPSEAVTVVEAVALAEPVEPPPVPQPMTDDDLEFAKRMVQQTRTINFRGAVKSAPSEGLDRTAQRLRDQVRLLERQLARLAFVYQARSRVFEGAEQLLAEAEERRETTSRHWQAAREREAHKEAAWQKERAEHHAQQQAFSERLNALETVVADLAGQTGGLWAASQQSSKALGEGMNRVLDAINSLHRTLQEPWKVARPAASAVPADDRAMGRLEGVEEEEAPILLTDVVEPRPSPALRPSTIGPWRYLQWVFGALILIPAVLVLWPDAEEPPPASPPVAELAEQPPAANDADPVRVRREQMAAAAAAERWAEVVDAGAALGREQLGADETWVLAEAYRRLGRPALAEKTYWRFIETFAEDRRSSQAWLWVADLLARQERVGEAADIYEMLATEGEDAVRRKAVLLLQRLRSVAPGDPGLDDE